MKSSVIRRKAMKFYTVKYKATGEYVKLGRAGRDKWDHFPTNVMKQNIPEEELADYEIEYWDLYRATPLRKYNFERNIIR